MDEARGGLGLFLEALYKLGVASVLLEHHLDRHGSVEHFIAPEIDAAHAASSEFALQKKVTVFTKHARRLNQLHITHFIVPHLGLMIGQKTHAALPVTFFSGTVPQ